MAHDSANASTTVFRYGYHFVWEENGEAIYATDTFGNKVDIPADWTAGGGVQVEAYPHQGEDGLEFIGMENVQVFRYGNNLVYEVGGAAILATDMFGRQINIPANYTPGGGVRLESGSELPGLSENRTGISGIRDAPPLTTGAERFTNTPAGNPVGQGYADAGYGQGTGLTGGSQSGAGGQVPVPGGGSSGGGTPRGSADLPGTTRHGSQPLPGGVLNLDPEELLKIMFQGGDTLVRRPPRLGSPYRDNISQQAQRLVSSPGLFNSQGDSASNFAVRNAGANAFGIQRQQAQGQISKQRGNLFFGAVNDLQRNEDINRNDLMQMLLSYRTNQNRLAQEGAHFDQSLEQQASEFNRNLTNTRGEQKRDRADSYVNAFAGLAAVLVPLLLGRNTGTVRGGSYPNGNNGLPGGYGGFG